MFIFHLTGWCRALHEQMKCHALHLTGWCKVTLAAYPRSAVMCRGVVTLCITAGHGGLREMEGLAVNPDPSVHGMCRTRW